MIAKLPSEEREKLNIVKYSSKEEYIRSLILIYDTIMKYKNSLQLQQDIYLYRGICGTGDEEPENISRSELISASLDRAIAKKFFRDSKNPILFMMKLRKKTNFMVVPYRLVSHILNYEKGRELVKYEGIDDNHDNNLENSEIILFNSEIAFERIKSTTIDEGDRKITVIEEEGQAKNKDERGKNAKSNREI